MLVMKGLKYAVELKHCFHTKKTLSLLPEDMNNFSLLAECMMMVATVANTIVLLT